MQSKQYFTKIKNYPHEKSTEPEKEVNPTDERTYHPVILGLCAEMNQNRTKPAFYSKDENALLVLFIQFLRNAECCIQFEYGSNGKTDNPLITVHRKHQYSRKNQRNGTKDLLPPQSLDDKVLAIIPISHHLYLAEHHRTHCVYKRSKIPTGYLQYCTKQQQPGTCHKYYIIKILHCSKT